MTPDQAEQRLLEKEREENERKNKEASEALRREARALEYQGAVAKSGLGIAVCSNVAALEHSVIWSVLLGDYPLSGV